MDDGMRTEMLAAIATAYDLMAHLPEPAWGSVHDGLRAGLESLDIDVDALPDTCRDRAAALRQM